MTHFSRKSLSIAISAMLGVGLFSTGASAEVIIYDDAIPGSKAISYASEIVRDENTKLVNITPLLNIQVDFGIAGSAAKAYFPRIDLTGAVFANNAAGLTLGAETLVITDGGSIGPPAENFVVGSFTASGTPPIKLDNMVLELYDGTTDTLAALQLTSGSSAVTASYRLYESLAGAQNQTQGQQIAATKTAEIINFSKSGIDFTATPNASPPKIDVSSQSKKFEGAVTVVELGTLKIGEPTGAGNEVYLPKGVVVNDTGTEKVISVAGTGTKLTIEGNFAAAKASTKKVYLADVTCGTAPTSTKVATLTDTKAEWLVNNSYLNDYLTGSATGGAADVYVCMEVDGVTEIVPAEFNVSYVTSPANGFTAATKTGKLALLKKNGTIMTTPFVTISPSYSPSRAIIVNSSAADIPFTVTVIGPATGADTAAATATLGTVTSGKILANSAYAVQMSEVLTGLSKGTRAALRFSLSGECSQLTGTYQMVSPDGTQVVAHMEEDCGS